MLLVIARKKSDGGRSIAAQRARILVDVGQSELLQFLGSGQDNLLLGTKYRVVVERRNVDPLWRIAERFAAKVELALLKGHETCRSKETAPMKSEREREKKNG